MGVPLWKARLCVFRLVRNRQPFSCYKKCPPLHLRIFVVSLSSETQCWLSPTRLKVCTDATMWQQKSPVAHWWHGWAPGRVLAPEAAWGGNGFVAGTHRGSWSPFIFHCSVVSALGSLGTGSLRHLSFDWTKIAGPVLIHLFISYLKKWLSTFIRGSNVDISCGLERATPRNRENTVCLGSKNDLVIDYCYFCLKRHGSEKYGW